MTPPEIFPFPLLFTAVSQGVETTSLQHEQQWHPQLPHAPTLGDTDYIFHSYSQNPFMMAFHCISMPLFMFLTMYKYFQVLFQEFIVLSASLHLQAKGQTC